VLVDPAADVVAELDAWAADHKTVIQLGWTQFMIARGGPSWQEAEKLTRLLFANGHRIDVAAVSAQMPPALGRLTEGRLVLTVRGAAYYGGAKKYLRYYVNAVALAVDRYKDRRSVPEVDSDDIERLVGKPWMRRVVEELIAAEGWALRPAGEGPTGVRRFRIEAPAALALAGVKTLPKYLDAQANAWWGESADEPTRMRALRSSRAGGPHSAGRGPRLRTPEASSPTRSVDVSWLHPQVRDACGPLFAAGHLREGVERAVAAFHERLREISDLRIDGTALVNEALSPKGGRVVVADLATESGRSTQRGTHLVALGMVSGIRNPTAHGLTDPSPAEALEDVALLSWLARKLDNAARRRDGSDPGVAEGDS
jgi:uncharacterized protein (TIGR02391 family)